MDDQIWYIYDKEQQQGPFTKAKVQEMFTGTMISNSAYVFKAGWKEWNPIEECFEELELGKANEQASLARREGAPRASISGRVVIHNDSNLTIGTGVNISFSGIFVETKDELFSIGELIKLSIKAEGMQRPFNVTAEVVRYNVDDRWAVGYGLKFVDIDSKVVDEIRARVAETSSSDLNKKTSGQ